MPHVRVVVVVVVLLVLVEFLVVQILVAAQDCLDMEEPRQPLKLWAMQVRLVVMVRLMALLLSWAGLVVEVAAPVVRLDLMVAIRFKAGQVVQVAAM